MSRKYSQAAADLFPETGGWVDANGQMKPVEFAAILLNALTEYVGKESEARAILNSNETSALLLKLLPKQKQGRPNNPIERKRNAAWLDIHDWRMADAKNKKSGVMGTARYFHKELGIGSSLENVRRKLNELLQERKASKIRN